MAYQKKDKKVTVKKTEETSKLSKRGRPKKNIDVALKSAEKLEEVEALPLDEKVYNLYKGRFQKGDPRCGRKSNIQLLAERINPEDHESVIEKMISLAKAGDPTCMKLYMERFIPIEKPNRYIRASIKELLTLDDMHKAMNTIIVETADAQHDIDDAQKLFNMVKDKKSITNDQLMEEIEGKLEHLKKVIGPK